MGNPFIREQAVALCQEAQHHHQDGNLDRAIDLYSKSIALCPTAEAHTFRGWAYSFQFRFDEAIEECKKAISIDPERGNAYNDIGCYLATQGKERDAIDWFERAKAAPKYDLRHYPYLNLARIFLGLNQLGGAVRECQEALRCSPGDPVCTALLKDLQRQLH